MEHLYPVLPEPPDAFMSEQNISDLAAALGRLGGQALARKKSSKFYVQNAKKRWEGTTKEERSEMMKRARRGLSYKPSALKNPMPDRDAPPTRGDNAN